MTTTTAPARTRWLKIAIGILFAVPIAAVLFVLFIAQLSGERRR